MSSPRLTVLAGPTAVGKGTVAAWVREHHPEVWLSVSATTRPPRPGEIDGVHYCFMSGDEFAEMVTRGEMLEWAVVHGRASYGTPRGPVDDALAGGGAQAHGPQRGAADEQAVVVGPHVVADPGLVAGGKPGGHPLNPPSAATTPPLSAAPAGEQHRLTVAAISSGSRGRRSSWCSARCSLVVP